MAANNRTEEGSQQVARNGNPKHKKCTISCVSKDLYDQPPQSDYIVVQFFLNFVHSTFIVLSKLRLGQILISILDYYMVKIENTLDFCCPDNFEFADPQVVEKHKNLSVRDRPMTWIFFIPALILLRIFRFTISVYSIIFGKGEITAQQMQSKIIAFRRYYRSIRHYAVDKWTEDDKKLIETRKSNVAWRYYYRIYEVLFMTQPRVEHHHNGDDDDDEGDSNVKADNAEKEKDKREKSPKVNGKKSLNVSSSSEATDTDEELNPMELLDKYADLDSTADPDYKPDSSNLNSTLDSIGTDDEEARKTESQIKLNEDEGIANSTYSSDIERTETDKRSPPEKAYASDSEVKNGQQN